MALSILSVVFFLDVFFWIQAFARARGRLRHSAYATRAMASPTLSTAGFQSRLVTPVQPMSPGLVGMSSRLASDRMEALLYVHCDDGMCMWGLHTTQERLQDVVSCAAALLGSDANELASSTSGMDGEVQARHLTREEASSRLATLVLESGASPLGEIPPSRERARPHSWTLDVCTMPLCSGGFEVLPCLSAQIALEGVPRMLARSASSKVTATAVWHCTTRAPVAVLVATDDEVVAYELFEGGAHLSALETAAPLLLAREGDVPTTACSFRSGHLVDSDGIRRVVVRRLQAFDVALQALRRLAEVSPFRAPEALLIERWNASGDTVRNDVSGALAAVSRGWAHAGHLEGDAAAPPPRCPQRQRIEARIESQWHSRVVGEVLGGMHPSEPVTDQGLLDAPLLTSVSAARELSPRAFSMGVRLPEDERAEPCVPVRTSIGLDPTVSRGAVVCFVRGAEATPCPAIEWGVVAGATCDDEVTVVPLCFVAFGGCRSEVLRAPELQDMSDHVQNGTRESALCRSTALRIRLRTFMDGTPPARMNDTLAGLAGHWPAARYRRERDLACESCPETAFGAVAVSPPARVSRFAQAWGSLLGKSPVEEARDALECMPESAAIDALRATLPAKCVALALATPACGQTIADRISGVLKAPPTRADATLAHSAACGPLGSAMLRPSWATRVADMKRARVGNDAAAARLIAWAAPLLEAARSAPEDDLRHLRVKLVERHGEALGTDVGGRAAVTPIQHLLDFGEGGAHGCANLGKGLEVAWRYADTTNIFVQGRPQVHVYVWSGHASTRMPDAGVTYTENEGRWDLVDVAALVKKYGQGTTLVFWGQQACARISL